MRVGILKQDGGPIPPDAWAEETAGEIMSLVKVEDRVDDTPEAKELKRKARSDKMRLEADLVEVLESYHDAVQKYEQDQLDKNGDDRLSTPYEPHPDHLDEAVHAVVFAAQKYPRFADAFKSDNGQGLIRSAIKNHFATAMHIERGWHVDRKVAKGEHSDSVRNFNVARNKG